MGLSTLTLSLFQTSGTDVTSSLLAIAHGTASASSAGGGDPVGALLQAERSETKGVALVASQPQTAREIANFKAAVASAKTPADLLKNPDALKVLLTANGLGDQAQFPALASKALLSNTAKAGSLASALSNTAWLSTAKTYDFANKGLALLRDPKAIASIVSGYSEVQWRTSLDKTTPGLSNALDFRSRASTIKTVDQILGDATFRKVVTTALGVPEQIAFQTLNAQENAISSRLDITKFQDAAFVDQFTKRYLIQAQAAGTSSGSSSSTSSSGVLSLFA